MFFIKLTAVICLFELEIVGNLISTYMNYWFNLINTILIYLFLTCLKWFPFVLSLLTVLCIMYIVYTVWKCIFIYIFFRILPGTSIAFIYAALATKTNRFGQNIILKVPLNNFFCFIVF